MAAGNPSAAARQHQRWFTEAEAGVYVGRSARWMKRHRLQGEIPYSKRCKSVLYERGDLDRLIEAQRVSAFRGPLANDLHARSGR